MKINADFDKRVVVHSEELDWLESPMPGVSRRPLDRIGGEIARATTIVRYAPGSKFSPHVHTGGEEFIVLDGVFQDEQGDFPAGSYVRNPPRSSHTPGSKPGCVIFVKLWQFDPNNRTYVRLNTDFMEPVPLQLFEGISVTPLYKDAYEEVTLFTFEPNAKLVINVKHGAELLVIEGEVTEVNDLLVKNSWLRVPGVSRIEAVAGLNGSKVWIKQNHLNTVGEQIERVGTVSR